MSRFFQISKIFQFAIIMLPIFFLYFQFIVDLISTFPITVGIYLLFSFFLLNNIKIIKAVFLAIVMLNFSNTSYCVFQGQEIMFEFLLEIRAITNDIQFDLAGKAKLNGETTTLMPRRIFASDTMVTNFSSEIANKLGYNSIKVNPNVDIFSVSTCKINIAA